MNKMKNDPDHSTYQLLHVIGQGQFSQVFLGIHCPTGQYVALKKFASGQCRRFLHELNVLLAVQHPYVVNCQGMAYVQGHRYLVMDYYEGGTLRQRLREVGAFSSLEALQLVEQLLQAIAAVHQQGIIHRDLKPENLLLSQLGSVFTLHLSDFGVAQCQHIALPTTVTQHNTGSPAYMAPECFYGEASPASDLYAIGVILLELLTGERPFIGTPGDLMTAHLSQYVMLPQGLPFPIRSILQRSLQKLPQKRYASAEEMLAAVSLAQTILTASPIDMAFSV